MIYASQYRQNGDDSLMLWRELLAEGESVLRQENIAEASLDAWYLLEYVSGMSRADYFMHREESVDAARAESYLDLIKKRGSHVPLQHLTGCQEFMGLEFLVDSRVLVPRQETELLVEKLLPLVQGRKVLDLCTGSGCIAISLSVLGKPLSVDATDLSEDALQLAEKNAKCLQADVTFFKSNLFQGIRDRYDIIVSNPPYIATETVKTLMLEVREHEPGMALDGGVDGLDFYRNISGEARKYLMPEGMLWLEIGYDQRESVSRLLREQGFDMVECYKDLCGMDRVISAKK